MGPDLPARNGRAVFVTLTLAVLAGVSVAAYFLLITGGWGMAALVVVAALAGLFLAHYGIWGREMTRQPLRPAPARTPRPRRDGWPR